jgi:hypothetical protein
VRLSLERRITRSNEEAKKIGTLGAAAAPFFGALSRANFFFVASLLRCFV